jgi:hypothetical protein
MSEGIAIQLNDASRVGQPCETLDIVRCDDGSIGSMIHDPSGNCVSTCPDALSNKILPSYNIENAVVKSWTEPTQATLICPLDMVACPDGTLAPRQGLDCAAQCPRAIEAAAAAAAGGGVLGLGVLAAAAWWLLKK